jgi:hypothetical protein
MALKTRTVTEALNLAIAIGTPRATDVTLSAAERAQISECLTRLTAILGDVNVNTNLVPANRRQGDASALLDRVHALTIIDDKYFEPGVSPMYDMLDLMSDIADAILAAVPAITSDLGSLNP